MGRLILQECPGQQSLQREHHARRQSEPGPGVIDHQKVISLGQLIDRLILKVRQGALFPGNAHIRVKLFIPLRYGYNRRIAPAVCPGHSGQLNCHCSSSASSWPSVGRMAIVFLIGILVLRTLVVPDSNKIVMVVHCFVNPHFTSYSFLCVGNLSKVFQTLLGGLLRNRFLRASSFDNVQLCAILFLKTFGIGNIF